MNCNKKIMKAAFSGFLTLSVMFSACVPALAANETTTQTESEAIVLSDQEPVVTLDRVNFRTGPSTDYQIIATLNRGTQVEFVFTYGTGDSAWSQVSYNGTNGYIKTEFLANKSAVPAGSVELLPWSEAKQVLTTGVSAEVYDVYTGLTYYVKSFSNGSHADVEPVTKEDTAIMFQTYGNQWKWDPRPVWVTINGRTMAASINGMPHGGGVNSSNGMNGQVCIHFLDSKTHNGNTSFTKWHQDVLIDAYNMSLK